MRKVEWQLMTFTILTQTSVGAFTYWGIGILFLPYHSPLAEEVFSQRILVVILFSLVVGAVAAAAHLSKPLRSSFAIVNIASSWLSREALLAGLFGLNILVLVIRSWMASGIQFLDQSLIVLGLLLGFSLVYAISRLYMLRTVPAWNNLRTPLSFFLTSFLLGLVVLMASLVFLTIRPHTETIVQKFHLGSQGVLILMIGQLFSAWLIMGDFQGQSKGMDTRWQDTRPDLKWLQMARWGTAFLGIILLFRYQPDQVAAPTWSLIPLTLLFLSEVLGRFLFYAKYYRVGY